LYIGVCHLPKKTGPCRGSFNKYFYNGATGQCERFTYGGCKGNENNFDTKAECEVSNLNDVNNCAGRCTLDTVSILIL
jgi:hypothetical protein